MTLLNRIHFLSLLLPLSMLAAPSVEQNTASTTNLAPIKINLYQAIAKENLKSLSGVEEQAPCEMIDYSNFSAADWDNLEKKEFEKLLHPEPAARRRSIFGLLTTFEESNPLPHTDVIDHITWLDLELLCGQKSNPNLYVAAQLDRTVTEAGKVTFYRKVVSPTNDVQALRNQQAITMHLLNNERLFNDLDTKLKALVESENLMLSYWYGSYNLWEAKQDKVEIPLSSKVTALKEFEHFLNTSPVAWELRNAEERTLGRVFDWMSKALLLYCRTYARP